MPIAFPTGHIGNRSMSHGTPGHARPCQCDKPLIDRDSAQCFRCGKYPKATIHQTFHERAQQIASRARRARQAA